MLYQSEKTGKELREEAEMAKNTGLKVDELSLTDIIHLEPDAQPNVSGGFYYHADNHLNPSVLMHSLFHSLQKKGVIFIKNHTVKKVHISDKKAVNLETDKGNNNCRNVEFRFVERFKCKN